MFPTTILLLASTQRVPHKKAQADTLASLHQTVGYPSSLPSPSIKSILAYLELRMAMKKQHIHHRQLIDISMSLELLPYFRSHLRDRHVERVHLLDLGRLTSFPSQQHEH